MKKQKGHLIKTVKPDSIAEEMGIEPGDRLLEINGETVEQQMYFLFHRPDAEGNAGNTVF